MQLKKRFITTLLIFLGAWFCFGGSFICKVFAQEEVYLGGFPAGFVLNMQGVQIVGFSDVITDNGVRSPAKAAGLKSGDVIVELDGEPIICAEDLENACQNFTGKIALLTFIRDGERLKAAAEPAKDLSSGTYRLGILIRDSVSGIGTVTYVKKDGDFGALGHPVYDETGKIMKISGGNSYKCNIIGVTRGEKGAPGELRGLFFKEQKQGEIIQNTACGIFGKLDQNFSITQKTVPVAGIAEVRMGEASIFTTVDGEEPKEYSISIVKIDRNNKDNKNFVIKITDKELLSVTNGIVQGMSGSPILQNGKIVGAVTHVFVNNPERGYGVSIEKMLKS